MESLVYLQLCCLHESSSPAATAPSQGFSRSALLLATTLLLTGWGAAEKTYAQSLWDSGDRVRQIQFRLQVLGYDSVQPTGLYDLNTQAAIVDFQRRNGLEADGVVGRSTRPILFGREAENSDWNNSLANGDTRSAFAFPPEGTNVPSTLPQFPEPFRNEGSSVASSFESAPNRDYVGGRTLLASRVLRYGDRGEDVRIVQQHLRKRGYYYDRIDGEYGSNLTDAVTRFQRDNNLWPDGIVGARTLAALGLSNLGGDGARGYVVVVPGDNDMLYRVQRLRNVSNARLQSSRRGNFVNAGQFPSRHEAESLAAQLRAQGLDARVAYNP